MAQVYFKDTAVIFQNTEVLWEKGTVAHLLIVDSASHAHSADSITLLQQYVLTVAVIKE